MNSKLRRIAAASALVGGLTMAPVYAATAAPTTGVEQQQTANQDLKLTVDGLKTQHAPVVIFADLAPGESAEATIDDLGLTAPVRDGAGAQVANLIAPVPGWGDGEHSVTVRTNTGRVGHTTFTATPDAGVTAEMTGTPESVQLNGAGLPAQQRGSVTVRDEAGQVVGTQTLTADDRGVFSADVPVNWGDGTHTVSVSSDAEQAEVWAQKLLVPTR